MEKLSNGLKNGLLMGDIDQDPRVKCSDLDRMERPRGAKQKGWIMENGRTDGEGMEM